MTSSFHASFVSRASEAAAIREGFVRWCEEEALPESSVQDMALALQEALDNVVEHAYGAALGRVDVEASVHEGSVAVTVRDRGPAFDPSAAPSGPLPERTDGGGLGLRVVRGLVDELRWERRDGENRLLLTKRLPLP